MEFKDYLNKTEEIGEVKQVFHPIVFVDGLRHVKLNEVVVFENDSIGQVMSIGRDYVEVLVYSSEIINFGTRVTRTDEKLSIGVGNGLLGKRVNSLGYQVGARLTTRLKEKRLVDTEPAKLSGRLNVKEPLLTGIRVIDMALPLGLGQRELVIGQRKIGKTGLLRQISMAHAQNGGIVVYAAIAKRKDDLADLVKFFASPILKESSVIVESTASETAGLIYLTPYTAMTIAEYFRDKGKDVLVVLDDLSIHAKHYREITLLLRRFPGRSSYPGDIFHIHARLMERAGNFEKGSITCIPVGETQSESISGFISTNLMSMTDGHIYLDRETYNQGMRPSINPLLSVTRVGHQTQTPLMRSTSTHIARFKSKMEKTEQLAHFGEDVSNEAKKAIARNKILTEFFNQRGDSITPYVVGLVLIAYIWSDIWEGVDGSIQQITEAATNQYAKDKKFKDKVDKIVGSTDKFSGLVTRIEAERDMIGALTKTGENNKAK